MPWKGVTVMEKKAAFIEQLAGQDRTLTDLCHEFGVSRKTAYKLLKRVKELGSIGRAVSLKISCFNEVSYSGGL